VARLELASVSPAPGKRELALLDSLPAGVLSLEVTSRGLNRGSFGRGLYRAYLGVGRLLYRLHLALRFPFEAGDKVREAHARPCL
jgi:hypothetical protein